MTDTNTILDLTNELKRLGFNIRGILEKLEYNNYTNPAGKSFTYSSLQKFLKKYEDTQEEEVKTDKQDTQEETNIEEGGEMTTKDDTKKDGKKKTRKKITYDKVSQVVDMIYDNPSLTIHQLADNAKTNQAAVAKIKKTMTREWMKVTQDTPLPPEYFTSNNIAGYVTKKMYDLGFVAKG